MEKEGERRASVGWMEEEGKRRKEREELSVGWRRKELELP